MASIVDIQDLTKLTAQSTLLQPPDSTILDSISIISGFQPTPPLSPEHESATTISLQPIILAESHIEDQTAEALLDEMLKCEQIPSVTIPCFEATEDFTDSQGSFSSSNDPTECLLDPNLLLNDCCKLMWNSHAYEPRSLIGGPYTPAPSPPPDKTSEEPKSPVELVESVEPEELEELPEQPEESECISPCDIFPTYSIVGEKGPVKTQLKRATTNSVFNESPRHSRATSSESGMSG